MQTYPDNQAQSGRCPGTRLRRCAYGDGSPGSETATATTSHIYRANGRYFAALRVRDTRGALSELVRAQIDVGNSPPAVTILSPEVSARFQVGQVIVLAGRAIDAQDGTLPAEHLGWRVILHHNDHVHPFLGLTSGASITIAAPPPEDLAAALSSYLEIELTATDSAGLTSVITQELRPRLVQLTFDTWPRTRTLLLGGAPITAPHTVVSWEGYALDVVAPNQLSSSGLPLSWLWWSDGGAASHTIITPGSATAYVATFRSPDDTLIWLPLASIER